MKENNRIDRKKKQKINKQKLNRKLERKIGKKNCMYVFRILYTCFDFRDFLNFLLCSNCSRIKKKKIQTVLVNIYKEKIV